MILLYCSTSLTLHVQYLFMEVVQSQDHREEIILPKHTIMHYLAYAQRAAAHLHWYNVAYIAGTATWQTPGNEAGAGDIISITIDTEKAILQSRPVNEYYWDEAQSRKNIEQFKALVARIIEQQERADRNLHPMHREKYGALILSKSYVVTPLIVYSNVLVFITMVIAGLSPLSPTAQSLFQWGGNFRPAVQAGQWWRLISYMFLHGGALHLLMNTFALLYIGMFLEPLLGRFRFASAYLLTGICAGLMSIAMHPYSVGVGASGAIFGMYGVFLSVLTTTHIQKTLRKTMLRSILFFVVFNLMTGLQGNTDNAAHIGGLISGFIIGYVYYYGIARKASLSRQVLTTAILTVVVTILASLTVHLLQ